MIEAPIVGENSIGMRLACRSFQTVIRRSASSNTWPSVAPGAGRRLRLGLPIRFYLAPIESHVTIVTGVGCKSTENRIAAWCLQPRMRRVIGGLTGRASGGLGNDPCAVGFVSHLIIPRSKFV